MKDAEPFFLSLGANVGDPVAQLTAAVAALRATPGLRVRKVSSLYRSEPVGRRGQPPFLNAVVAGVSTWAPAKLLTIVKQIERRLGRRPGPRWGPRTIDIDILSFGARRVRSRRLVIPHPRLTRRRFVLIPLLEVAPAFHHPVSGGSAQGFLRRLTLRGQRVTMVGRWKKSRFQLFSGKPTQADQSSP